MVEEMKQNNFENKSKENQSEEENKIKSVEDIFENAERLKQSIAAAKQAKEENINKQLGERECLYAAQMNNDKLIKETESVLEYFETLDKADVELLTKEEKDELAKMQETVKVLYEQRQAIDEKTNVISSSPEVLAKLQDEAIDKDKVFEAEKMEKEFLEKIPTELDELVETAKILEVDYKDLKKTQEEEDASYKAAVGLFRKAEKLTKDRNIGSRLYTLSCDFNRFDSEIGDMNDSIDAKAKFIQEYLNNLRGDLGMFAGKDKAAIDYVKNNLKIIKEYYEKIKERREKNKKSNHDVELLADQYNEIIFKAWDEQYKINKLMKVEGPRPVPVETQRLLQTLVDKNHDKPWCDNISSVMRGDARNIHYYDPRKEEKK